MAWLLKGSSHGKPSKNFRKAPFSKFTETLAATGMTAPALSLALGYADNSHSSWKETSQMPFVAALACDALIAKAKVGPLCGSLLVLRTSNKDQTTTVETLCKAMQIQWLSLDNL